MAAVQGKHVFISYVKEDGPNVDRLCKALEAAQIPYWRDRTALAPGDNWKAEIKSAIRSGTLIFLACFSDHSRSRLKSIMNEELTLAVEEYRQMAPGVTWLIPIRFDEGELPEWDLGAGRALSDLNYVDLFGAKYTTEAVSLVTVINRAMGTSGLDQETTRAAVEEAAEADRPALLRHLTKEMVLDPVRRIELDALISQEAKNILSAMRDENRFPTKKIEGSDNAQRNAYLAVVAESYWKLVEPFCWSLQVAARWAPDAATIYPWANALRAICIESTGQEGGNTVLLKLRAIPAMVATFVAALSCTGQQNWGILKILVIDNVITDKWSGRKVPLVEATNPWLPFEDTTLVPNILARCVSSDEVPESVAAAYIGGEIGKYHAPVAEWLFKILRPIFDEQFTDDTTFATEFDLAEVMMGIISQDQALLSAGDDSHRQSWARSSWFGRSVWRARNGRVPNPVVEVAERKLSEGVSWSPLTAGLFGDSSDRADKAISAYAEEFGRAGRQYM